MNFKAPSKVEGVELSGTPSQRFNNLSLSSNLLAAYVDRATVRVDDVSGGGGGGDSRCVSVPGAQAVMQAQFVTINCLEYLGVASDQGFALFSVHGDELLAQIGVESIPGNAECLKEPSRAKYCCGMSGVEGTPLCAVGTSEGTIVVLHYGGPNDLSVERSLRGHRRPVCTMAATVSHIASGDESGQVIVWHAAALEEHCHFPSMGHPCSCIAMRADTVIAGFASGVVRIYNLARRALELEIDAHCRALNALHLHPFQKVFATAAEDGFLNVWRLPDKRNTEVSVLSSQSLPHNLLVGVAFAKDSSGKIATTSYDTKTLTMRSP